MSSRGFEIGGVSIRRGASRDIRLKFSETYLGDDLAVPVRVVRGARPGPTVFVTAAIHGDEINGTGIVHGLLYNESPNLQAGTLILVPVVNVFGFESHERYLPDRRDLNRSFPGSAHGSLTSRFAARLMQEVVRASDYGIDLHSAAFQRTNYPNIRGDLALPGVRRIARAFGCPLIVDGKGPVGSLRREACRRGCPTIILEAGEPWKIEPGVQKVGEMGVRNVLRALEMVPGQSVRPPFQTVSRRTVWVRATIGGLLKFHVSAGDFVERDQPIATAYSIMGDMSDVVSATVDGIALGMTTMPAVKPGEPICHIAVPQAKLSTLRRALRKARPDLHSAVQEHLATNFDVVDYTG